VKLAVEHKMDVAFDIMKIDDTESDSPVDIMTESDSPVDELTESDSSEEDIPPVTKKRLLSHGLKSQVSKRIKLESDINMMSPYSHVSQSIERQRMPHAHNSHDYYQPVSLQNYMFSPVP
jgi:hypothetical protein